MNDERQQVKICEISLGSFLFFLAFVNKKENINETSAETMEKTKGKIQLLGSNLLCKKDEAPQRAATRARLSLDGRPKKYDVTPKMITVSKAETIDKYPLVMEIIDFVTAPPTKNAMIAPEKLNMPHKRHAFPSDKIFVFTTDEIDAGASVQPFTNVAPKRRNNVKIARGVSKFDKKLIEFPFC